MQYIRKENTQPSDWESWFLTGSGKRSYDYKQDETALSQKSEALKYLLEEQGNLCAYCQRQLTTEAASIEHIIPKSLNKELSTNYYNLVAVCRKPHVDESGKLSCDKSRRNEIMTPLVLHSDFQVLKDRNHAYLQAGSDGSVIAKERTSKETKAQVDAFLTLTNVGEHSLLKIERTNLLIAIDKNIRLLRLTKEKVNEYYQVEFDKIISNNQQPHRQFLLMILSKKLGRN